MPVNTIEARGIRDLPQEVLEEVRVYFQDKESQKMRQVVLGWAIVDGNGGHEVDKKGGELLNREGKEEITGIRRITFIKRE